MPPFQPSTQAIQSAVGLFERSSSSSNSASSNAIIVLPILLAIFIPIMLCVCSSRRDNNNAGGEETTPETEWQPLQEQLRVPAVVYQPGLVDYYGTGRAVDGGGSRSQVWTEIRGGNDRESSTRAVYGNNDRSDDGAHDNITTRDGSDAADRGSGSRHGDGRSLTTQDFEAPPPAYTP